MADTRNAATRLADGSLAGTWVLATEQTTVAFRSSSLWGLIKARGRFTQVHGEGTLDGGGALAGRMVIDVASVDTGNAGASTSVRPTSSMPPPIATSPLSLLMYRRETTVGCISTVS